MQTKATTVAAYLAALPADRRAMVEALRAAIRSRLAPEIEEGIQYGMIGYFVPHRVYPPGYHCDPTQPLPVAGLASQKSCVSLYLSSIYDGFLPGEAERFQAAYRASGKRLDMGKGCVRFRKAEDIPLDVIADAVGRIHVGELLKNYEAMRANRASSKPKAAKRPSAAKATGKATTKATAKATTEATGAAKARGAAAKQPKPKPKGKPPAGKGRGKAAP